MNTIYAAVSTLIYAVLTVGAMQLVGNVAQQGPARLQLEYLRFEDGHFRQHLSVTGATAINAQWSARIWRDDGTQRHLLCSGGGVFPYDGTPSRAMTPSYWTDDDCPELQPGDKALGVWEFTDDQGMRRRLSGSIIIP